MPNRPPRASEDSHGRRIDEKRAFDAMPCGVTERVVHGASYPVRAVPAA
jgi:hypothetical protein